MTPRSKHCRMLKLALWTGHKDVSQASFTTERERKWKRGSRNQRNQKVMLFISLHLFCKSASLLPSLPIGHLFFLTSRQKQFMALYHACKTLILHLLFLCNCWFFLYEVHCCDIESIWPFDWVWSKYSLPVYIMMKDHCLFTVLFSFFQNTALNTAVKLLAKPCVCFYTITVKYMFLLYLKHNSMPLLINCCQLWLPDMYCIKYSIAISCTSAFIYNYSHFTLKCCHL